jgi:hypothetical protein
MTIRVCPPTDSWSVEEPDPTLVLHPVAPANHEFELVEEASELDVAEPPPQAAAVAASIEVRTTATTRRHHFLSGRSQNSHGRIPGIRVSLGVKRLIYATRLRKSDYDKCQ